MSRWRWLSAGAAVAAFGAFVAGADAVVRAPVNRAAAALGSDYALVVVVGFAALAAAGAALLGRTGTERSTPSPAPTRSAPRPGAEFDQFVERSGLLSARGDGDAVRERLCTLAVRIIEHETGCTRREARRRVRDGAWTDDRSVAAFLRDPPGRPGVGVVFAAALRRQRPTRYLARRAARELIDRHGGAT